MTVIVPFEDHYSNFLTKLTLIPFASTMSTPLNDLCPDATTVSVSTTLSSQSTVGAFVDTNPAGSSCGTSIDSPGVWYQTTGDGSNLLASTCSNETDFDTKISVFSGTCSSLQCVGGNDDATCSSGSGLQSTIGWQSLSGVDYFILVHGFGGKTMNETTIKQASVICKHLTTSQVELGRSLFMWDSHPQ